MPYKRRRPTTIEGKLERSAESRIASSREFLLNNLAIALRIGLALVSATFPPAERAPAWRLTADVNRNRSRTRVEKPWLGSRESREYRPPNNPIRALMRLHAGPVFLDILLFQPEFLRRVKNQHLHPDIGRDFGFRCFRNQHH